MFTELSTRMDGGRWNILAIRRKRRRECIKEEEEEEAVNRPSNWERESAPVLSFNLSVRGMMGIVA